MPLTKAQKALYEAALKRKGLKPGKRIEREAIRMMPDHLIRDNGWY